MTRCEKTGRFCKEATRTSRAVEDQTFIVIAGLFMVVITFAQTMM